MTTEADQLVNVIAKGRTLERFLKSFEDFGAAGGEHGSQAASFMNIIRAVNDDEDLKKCISPRFTLHANRCAATVSFLNRDPAALTAALGVEVLKLQFADVAEMIAFQLSELGKRFYNA